MTTFVKNSFVEVSGFFVIPLESCTFPQPFQQVGQLQTFLLAFGYALLGVEFFEVCHGDTVVAFGFGIGGKGVGVVAREFGVMDDELRVTTTFDKVMGDGRGTFLFAVE